MRDHILSNSLTETSRKLDWNGHTMFLKWHTMLFISDCHWGSNLIVLLCYSHILCQGLHHCLWLPLNWYYYDRFYFSPFFHPAWDLLIPKQELLRQKHLHTLHKEYRFWFIVLCIYCILGFTDYNLLHL